MTEYVELHARSAFSFLEGASLPEFVDAASRRTGDASDGAARPQRCLWCAALSHGRTEARCTGAHRSRGRGERSGTAIAACERICPISIRLNLCGCRCWWSHALAIRISAALLPISNYARVRRPKARRLPVIFEKYGKDLVCLTGGSEGPLAAALTGGGYDAAQQTVEQLVNIFGPA